ncbi:hypothetical protein BCR34DRAFT_339062 [Clohesyomyces aquaticus]|uniref:Uncharacterized protein n=1 Tax=Clohesyomyces aquaticus TaxID=1231657 RepID=A0A1Y1ZKW3_9PLEO|nr:hypothetical protein BCR34DRAFT_339062 [Clohesyomyces aquaticus]
MCQFYPRIGILLLAASVSIFLDLRLSIRCRYGLGCVCLPSRLLWECDFYLLGWGWSYWSWCTAVYELLSKTASEFVIVGVWVE